MMAAGDEVIETHVSWVTMHGDRVYKRKKPLRTSFLDFSTPEARRQACQDEVRLGRRLAPDVYLGVEELPGPDWAVVMRRMPADRSLASLVRAGEDVTAALRDVARRVASMHLQAGRSPTADAAASAAANLARWQANQTEMTPLLGRLADPARAEQALELAQDYLSGRDGLFTARIAAGRAVEGHGDLLADDIFLLDDGPRILDAIEFDLALREGDGLADIAFLAMDLDRLGHPELSDKLLSWYAEFAADHWPTSLAHFYIAYRAQVRAKVACIRAAQTHNTMAVDADELLQLALCHLRAGRVALILVGGPPATGKTSVARGLGEARDWVVLRSDEVRKELAGLPATAPAAAPLMAGVYSPVMTSLTYGALLDRARRLLQSGETVVLDATWGDSLWRSEAARVAADTTAAFVQLRCDVPVSVAVARATNRTPDASDAGPEIAAALAERFAPWPDATTIDTNGDPSQASNLAAAAVATALAS